MVPPLHIQLVPPIPCSIGLVLNTSLSDHTTSHRNSKCVSLFISNAMNISVLARIGCSSFVFVPRLPASVTYGRGDFLLSVALPRKRDLHNLYFCILFVFVYLCNIWWATFCYVALPRDRVYINAAPT